MLSCRLIPKKSLQLLAAELLGKQVPWERRALHLREQNWKSKTSGAWEAMAGMMAAPKLQESGLEAMGPRAAGRCSPGIVLGAARVSPHRADPRGPWLSMSDDKPDDS